METYAPSINSNLKALLIEEPEIIVNSDLIELNNTISLYNNVEYNKIITCNSLVDFSASTTTVHAKFTIPDTSLSITNYSNIEFLQDLYDLENPKEIKTILLHYYNIIPNLFTAYFYIKLKFNIAKPQMTLITDIEETDFKRLYIHIPINSEYSEAAKIFNDFIKNWFFKQPKSFRKVVKFGFLK